MFACLPLFTFASWFSCFHRFLIYLFSGFIFQADQGRWGARYCPGHRFCWRARRPGAAHGEGQVPGSVIYPKLDPPISHPQCALENALRHWPKLILHWPFRILCYLMLESACAVQKIQKSHAHKSEGVHWMESSGCNDRRLVEMFFRLKCFRSLNTTGIEDRATWCPETLYYRCIQYVHMIHHHITPPRTNTHWLVFTPGGKRIEPPFCRSCAIYPIPPRIGHYKQPLW